MLAGSWADTQLLAKCKIHGGGWNERGPFSSANPPNPDWGSIVVARARKRYPELEISGLEIPSPQSETPPQPLHTVYRLDCTRRDFDADAFVAGLDRLAGQVLKDNRKQLTPALAALHIRLDHRLRACPAVLRWIELEAWIKSRMPVERQRAVFGPETVRFTAAWADIRDCLDYMEESGRVIRVPAAGGAPDDDIYILDVPWVLSTVVGEVMVPPGTGREYFRKDPVSGRLIGERIESAFQLAADTNGTVTSTGEITEGRLLGALVPLAKARHKAQRERWLLPNGEQEPSDGRGSVTALMELFERFQLCLRTSKRLGPGVVDDPDAGAPAEPNPDAGAPAEPSVNFVFPCMVLTAMDASPRFGSGRAWQAAAGCRLGAHSVRTIGEHRSLQPTAFHAIKYALKSQATALGFEVTMWRASIGVIVPSSGVCVILRCNHRLLQMASGKDSVVDFSADSRSIDIVAVHTDTASQAACWGVARQLRDLIDGVLVAKFGDGQGGVDGPNRTELPRFCSGERTWLLNNFLDRAVKVKLLWCEATNPDCDTLNHSWFENTPSPIPEPPPPVAPRYNARTQQLFFGRDGVTGTAVEIKCTLNDSRDSSNFGMGALPAEQRLYISLQSLFLDDAALLQCRPKATVLWVQELSNRLGPLEPIPFELDLLLLGLLPQAVGPVCAVQGLGANSKVCVRAPPVTPGMDGSRVPYSFFWTCSSEENCASFVAGDVQQTHDTIPLSDFIGGRDSKYCQLREGREIIFVRTTFPGLRPSDVKEYSVLDILTSNLPTPLTVYTSLFEETRRRLSTEYPSAVGMVLPTATYVAGAASRRAPALPIRLDAPLLSTVCCSLKKETLLTEPDKCVLLDGERSATVQQRDGPLYFRAFERGFAPSEVVEWRPALNQIPEVGAGEARVLAEIARLRREQADSSQELLRAVRATATLVLELDMYHVPSVFVIEPDVRRVDGGGFGLIRKLISCKDLGDVTNALKGGRLWLVDMRTWERVRCGPDGKGYPIDQGLDPGMAEGLVRGLKQGLMLMKAWNTAAAVVTNLIKMLTLGVVAGGSAAKVNKTTLGNVDTLIEWIEGSTRADFQSSSGLRAQLKGHAMREFARFLKEADPEEEWGDLEKHDDPDTGRIIWTLPDDHDPSAVAPPAPTRQDQVLFSGYVRERKVGSGGSLLRRDRVYAQLLRRADGRVVVQYYRGDSSKHLSRPKAQLMVVTDERWICTCDSPGAGSSSAAEARWTSETLPTETKIWQFEHPGAAAELQAALGRIPGALRQGFGLLEFKKPSSGELEALVIVRVAEGSEAAKKLLQPGDAIKGMKADGAEKMEYRRKTHLAFVERLQQSSHLSLSISRPDRRTRTQTHTHRPIMVVELKLGEPS